MLNDTVTRITGSRSLESVPDHVFTDSQLSTSNHYDHYDPVSFSFLTMMISYYQVAMYDWGFSVFF